MPEPVVTPNTDRHGIRNEGKCIRCNLQIEGSGVRPEDVTIDAGNGPSANGPLAGQGKDVGIRAERADGFYLRNVTLQHAEEHGVYPVEVDGYAIDRVKMAYNHEYGHLAFTSDHGLIKNCEALGSGDAGVYPGASAQTGEQTIEKKQRYNHEITRVRPPPQHARTLGFDGRRHPHPPQRRVRQRRRDLGRLVLGRRAPGLPAGLAARSRRTGSTRTTSTPTRTTSGFEPTCAIAAVGTGLAIGRRQREPRQRQPHLRQLATRRRCCSQVPDELACDLDTPQQTCSPEQFAEQSNSHRNRFFNNVMGVAPEGRRGIRAGKVLPNGIDFWWANQTS